MIKSVNKALITDEIIATDLLVSSKTAVRNYAAAITKTISPEVHRMLKKTAR
ncbi:spore coat protein [Alteribacter natronophilus]|uniref:spore coat protein n=1 Tax=Alteribacter natronophilus TaxID=2583810 RepID=UPI001FEA3B3C|nr:spore coat protein [Alteribacter natronophilus]